ncbi:MAG TPA: FxLYD domain-containing protein [Methylomirabilota bacterium]|nr:FxLYD domain-containing protein [Methylomirabilota bacterium]
MGGEAWKCPHCGERILRSALTCPACRRHLRFDAVTTGRPVVRPTLCPLNVEGTIRHSGTATLTEYSVIIEVREDRGELIARRIVNVGALQPGQARRITLRVEMQAPEPSSSPASPANARQP